LIEFQQVSLSSSNPQGREQKNGFLRIPANVTAHSGERDRCA
jgi:hypothetical protein